MTGGEDDLPFLRRRDLLIAAGAWVVWPKPALAALSKPRRLTLFNAHTGETFDGLYRDIGGPIPNAMIDLAVLLRDHHSGAIGPVFIETLDFLADTLAAVGANKATVLSAYRTEATNRMLATRIFGVAEKSQHVVGRAIDITIDKGLSKAAVAARTLKKGGVGWYPDSHFLHIDSGPIRNWQMGGVGLSKLLVGRRSPPKKKGPATVGDRMARLRALARKQLKDRGGK